MKHGNFKLNPKRIIGYGFEATIYLSRCQKYAIKKYKNRYSNHIYKEHSLLKNKSCPYINIPLDIGFCDKSFSANSLIYPYYRNGDLFNFDEKLMSKKIKKRSKIYQNMFSTLWLGLDYCQNNNICHRDIKPENLYVKHIENKKKVIIGDFGLACESENIKKRAGTLSYLAPEILDPSFYINKKQYNYKVDIWSSGITLFKLIYNDFVYDKYKNNIINEGYKGFKSIRPDLWNKLDEKTKIILINTLQVYPNDRWDSKKFIDL